MASGIFCVSLSMPREERRGKEEMNEWIAGWREDQTEKKQSLCLCPGDFYQDKWRKKDVLPGIRGKRNTDANEQKMLLLLFVVPPHLLA